MKRLVPRKCRDVNSFWQAGIPFLMMFDILLIANCIGAFQHYQEIVNKPVKEIQVVEKKVEVIKEVIKYLPKKTSTTATTKATNVEQWRPLVSKYFGSKTDEALRIMACESGGNPNALSHTQDRGLFQINQCHRAKVGGNLNALFDPETNVRVAYQIYGGVSWRPWVCSHKVGLN
jgi:membrane-bound lytic murein transglycosylase MltF